MLQFPILICWKRADLFTLLANEGRALNGEDAFFQQGLSQDINYKTQVMKNTIFQREQSLSLISMDGSVHTLPRLDFKVKEWPGQGPSLI